MSKLETFIIHQDKLKVLHTACTLHNILLTKSEVHSLPYSTQVLKVDPICLLYTLKSYPAIIQLHQIALMLRFVLILN